MAKRAFRREIEDAQFNGEMLPETRGLPSWCDRRSDKPASEAIAARSALVVAIMCRRW
jgi:hypothetical protein